MAVADQLFPEWNLHGRALGDLKPALRGLLGEQTPLLPGMAAPVKKRWERAGADAQ